MDTMGAVQPPMQRTVLQAIYDAFRSSGSWPTFGQLDRPTLKQYKLDLAESVQSIPTNLLQPTWSGGVAPQATTSLRLTVEGLALCDGSDDDVNLFLRALRWFARQELRFEPGTDDPHAACKVTGLQLIRAFRMTKHDRLQVQRLGELLQIESWGALGVMPNEWKWTFTLGRDVRRFAAVRSLADYLEVQRIWRDAASQPIQPAAPSHMARRRLLPPAEAAVDYVDARLVGIIEEKKAASAWDCEKLLQLIQELNDNYMQRQAYASHALLRAILDHVPPLFGETDFKQVVNNYKWRRSDKKYAEQLLAAKVQGDDAMHRQISSRLNLLGFEDMPPRAALNAFLQYCVEKL